MLRAAKIIKTLADMMQNNQHYINQSASELNHAIQTISQLRADIESYKANAGATVSTETDPEPSASIPDAG